MANIGPISDINIRSRQPCNVVYVVVINNIFAVTLFFSYLMGLIFDIPIHLLLIIFIILLLLSTLPSFIAEDALADVSTAAGRTWPGSLAFS